MISRLLHSIFLVTFFVVGFCPQHVSAQQKVGYVNTDTILEQIPEYQGVQQQLDVISKEWRSELDQMQLRIDTLRKEFEAKEILYSEELKAEKQQQIRELEKEREAFLNEKFGPKGEYFQRQKKLLEPIQRKIYEAITTVSQREDIDFVFDRARNSSLIFGRKQWNLNGEVLRELGITLNE